MHDRRRRPGFADDIERPLHRIDVAGYLIGRTPVTHAAYRAFVDRDGYASREWWSEEGWARKRDNEITRPAG